MELEQAKEVVANMATREPAVYTKREQTSSWNRVYELAGETNYTRNGITISNTESAKLEYWDGESIDLSGLVVKYTGDNAYTEAVEKAELDDVCENWQSETSTARIESDDNVVDNKVTKMITVSAIENPSWTAEVEITVKEAIPTSMEVAFVDNNGLPINKSSSEEFLVFNNTKDFFVGVSHGNGWEYDIKVGYKLHWSSGSIDSKYAIATNDMISVDTSNVYSNTTATITYTDPTFGVSVSGTIDAMVWPESRIFATAKVSESGSATINIDTSKLPSSVVYDRGELLYNSRPIYIITDTSSFSYSNRVDFAEGEDTNLDNNERADKYVYPLPCNRDVYGLDNQVNLPIYTESADWSSAGSFDYEDYTKYMYEVYAYYDTTGLLLRISYE